jgi:hypothetical protein
LELGSRCRCCGVVFTDGAIWWWCEWMDCSTLGRKDAFVRSTALSPLSTWLVVGERILSPSDRPYLISPHHPHPKATHHPFPTIRMDQSEGDPLEFIHLNLSLPRTGNGCNSRRNNVPPRGRRHPTAVCWGAGARARRRRLWGRGLRRAWVYIIRRVIRRGIRRGASKAKDGAVHLLMAVATRGVRRR